MEQTIMDSKMPSSTSEVNQPEPSQPTSKSRIPVRKPSRIFSGKQEQPEEQKSISAVENIKPRILSYQYDSYRKTLPRASSPMARFSEDCYVQDDTIPAVIATRTYSRKPSGLSRPDTPIKTVYHDSSDNGDTEMNVDDEILTESDILTPFGEKANIPYNANLEIPFDLHEAKPLTYKDCRRLSMPADADEWSIAVIQQRWYQTIGSKLCVEAAVFKNEADQGLYYLQSWNKFVDAQNNILHYWAMNIMQELDFHILEPEKALLHNYEDGSWKIPSAIVPGLVEELPLALEQRQKYYGQVFVLFDEVAQEFEQKPCKKHGIVGHQCVELSIEEEILRSQYISRVMTGVYEICQEIGEEMRDHFEHAYPQPELRVIEDLWRDDLESDRIDAEIQEEERSVTMQKKRNSARYSISSGFPSEPDSSTGDAKPDTSALDALKSEKFDWADDDENEWDEVKLSTTTVPGPVPTVSEPASDALKSEKFNWGDYEESYEEYDWEGFIPLDPTVSASGSKPLVPKVSASRSDALKSEEFSWADYEEDAWADFQPLDPSVPEFIPITENDGNADETAPVSYKGKEKPNPNTFGYIFVNPEESENGTNAGIDTATEEDHALSTEVAIPETITSVEEPESDDVLTAETEQRSEVQIEENEVAIKEDIVPASDAHAPKYTSSSESLSFNSIPTTEPRKVPDGHTEDTKVVSERALISTSELPDSFSDFPVVSTAEVDKQLDVRTANVENFEKKGLLPSTSTTLAVPSGKVMQEVLNKWALSGNPFANMAMAENQASEQRLPDTSGEVMMYEFDLVDSLRDTGEHALTDAKTAVFRNIRNLGMWLVVNFG